MTPDRDAPRVPPGALHASGNQPGPFGGQRRSRWPRIHWGSVVAVAGGGFAGGLLRYVLMLAMPTPAGGFPWAIFVANTTGVFILALLMMLVLEVLPPTRYLRPAVGTGFCGGFTTFSSLTTEVDQLVAGGHAVTAAGYVLASLCAGLAAASLGIVLARSIAAHREKGRK